VTVTDGLDFDAVFDASPNSYMLLDRELRYVAANEAYVKTTGATREELLGRRLLDVFPHDPNNPNNHSAKLLRESLLRVLQTRRADVLAFIPYKIPRDRDGQMVLEERLWSATHTPILDDQGDVRYILQHTVDVTELTQLQRGLTAGVLRRAQLVQESKDSLEAELRHLRRLFEQAPGFVCVLRGPDHVFELVNSAYYQLIGHRPMIGKSVRRALPEIEGQGYFEELDRVYVTGQPFIGRGMRMRLQRQPGDDLEDVFVDFVYQPILDGDGKATGIFVQGNDITAQKLLEFEREERAAFERQLIGIVSHDLRTPINAIGIASALLRQRGNLEPHQERVVGRIESSAERARRLIRDFLDFTQARSTGHIPIVPAPANIREIAHQVLDEVHLTYPARAATLEHEGEETGIWDADRVAQLIGNLLSNAFQHGTPESTVRLRTEGRGDEVLIEVHNHGASIAPEDQARLFLPFERGRDSVPSSERSVGLGLYIAKQIVDAHEGTISLHSTPEKGTTFSVRLPRRLTPSA
jgi:PAS domain S-box-containing protein